jgi:hypothetical protein
MNLNALHRRLLQDVLEIGNAFPFVITGGLGADLAAGPALGRAGNLARWRPGMFEVYPAGSWDPAGACHL